MANSETAHGLMDEHEKGAWLTLGILFCMTAILLTKKAAELAMAAGSIALCPSPHCQGQAFKACSAMP